MTELQVEIAINNYQRRQREARNRELSLTMRGMETEEQFLSALQRLHGLRPKECERSPKILQTLA